MLMRAKPIYVIVRVILGLVFIYAGATKITDPLGFAAAIDEYGLVTWRMANLIARTLPIIEIISGLGLIFDIKGALGLVVAQLLGFVTVLAYAIHLGLDIDCGCFGPSDPAAPEPGGLWITMLRDLLMVTACVLLYWQRRILGVMPRSVLHLFSPRNQE